jgi:uncharacterized protein YgiM (DUF1202 family)
MNKLPDKDQNLPLTQTSQPEKPAANPATFQASGPEPKRNSGLWLRLLLVSLVVIAAVGGWLVFALNRPPVEINALSPGPATTRTTQSSQPAQTPAARITGATGSQIAASGQPTGATRPTSAKVQGYGVVISKVLNMRSAPNTDASVIKSLKSGDIVELTSRNGGWYQTGDGPWISAAYLEVRQTRPEAESYARELAAA